MQTQMLAIVLREVVRALVATFPGLSILYLSLSRRISGDQTCTEPISFERGRGAFRRGRTGRGFEGNRAVRSPAARAGVGPALRPETALVSN